MINSLRKNIFWNFISNFSNTFINLGVSIFLSRILSPQDYGIIGLAMAVLAIGNIFLYFGFTSSIIQDSNPTKAQLSTIFWLLLLISLIVCLLIILLSNQISDFYEQPKLRIVLIACSFMTPLMVIGGIPQALANKNMKFKELGKRSIIVSLLSGAIAILFALSGYGIWALVILNISSLFMNAIANFIIEPFIPEFKFKLSSISHNLRFGKYIFFTSMIENVFNKLDIFLIGKFFSMSEVGFLGRAQSVDALFKSNISGSLLNVMFPQFVKMDTEGVKILFIKTFEVICFTFSLLSGFLMITSPIIFLFVFGKQWIPSVIYFQIINFSAICYPLFSLIVALLESQGNSSYCFQIEVIKKILILPCFVILFYFGLKVYLFSIGLSSIIGLILSFYFVKKESGVNSFFLLNIILKYFPLAIFSSVLFLYFSKGLSDAYILFIGLLWSLLFLGLNYITKTNAMLIVLKQVTVFLNEKP
jgi:teichuronic acid exporter